MTIASAFNDIAVAQGGTAAKSGAITAAIDALNDALAGSDQPAAKTIEEAVRLLGEHIGGGGGSSTATCYIINMNAPTTPLAPADVTVQDSSQTAVATVSGQVTAMGETVECLSFTATAGASYYVGQGGLTFSGGTIILESNPDSELPSASIGDGMTFVSPNAGFFAIVQMSK